MQDDVSLRERQKYEKMWNEPIYRHVSPGYQGVSDFFDHFKGRLVPGDSIIDFGCGMGLTALPFLEAGLKTTLVDIAENCLQDKIAALSLLMPENLSFVHASLWDLPKSLEKSDWIYCFDVLEHIPPDKVDQTLKELASKTKKGGALQVYLEDEWMGSTVGETLHLTIQPLDWWLKKISTYWTIETVLIIVPNIRYCIFVGEPNYSIVL